MNGAVMSKAIEARERAKACDAAYRTHSEIERLVRAFESCTLPRAAWTHRAHLTVALWYLFHYSGEEAVMRIRNGIKRYNAANGVAMTKESGYHETMTLFWILIVSRFLMLAGANRSIVEIANEMIERFDDSGLPFEYYTRERLLSWRARTSWVEPDLKPFD